MQFHLLEDKTVCAWAQPSSDKGNNKFIAITYDLRIEGIAFLPVKNTLPPNPGCWKIGIVVASTKPMQPLKTLFFIMSEISFWKCESGHLIYLGPRGMMASMTRQVTLATVPCTMFRFLEKWLFDAALPVEPNHSNVKASWCATGSCRQIPLGMKTSWIQILSNRYKKTIFDVQTVCLDR